MKNCCKEEKNKTKKKHTHTHTHTQQKTLRPCQQGALGVAAMRKYKEQWKKKGNGYRENSKCITKEKPKMMNYVKCKASEDRYPVKSRILHLETYN